MHELPRTPQRRRARWNAATSGGCRLSNLALLWCCLLLMFPLRGARGMITVTDTGARFASRTDRVYGPPIKKGYKYKARLQFVGGNLDLCPDPSDRNRTQKLVLPYDGLTIALLVRSGGCTLHEKVNYIRNNLNLPNYVTFLIIDSSSADVEGSTEEWSLSGQEELISEAMDNGDDLIDYELHLDDTTGAEEFLLLDEGTTGGRISAQEIMLGRSSRNQRDQTTVPQRILHVSSRTQFQLLDLLMRQTTSSYESGGIKVEMDSRLGTTVMSSSSAMWIAFSALMGACCCSCVLIISGHWADDSPPPAPVHPNMRPQRRRLTKEQVKRMFPVYQFNGESLEPLGEALPLTAGAGDVLQAFVPSPLELECCSICLDEYEPGDRLRCLDPCHHAFHSSCIGRWLSERSATCPLCKTELYDPQEEEEDDSSDEEDQQQRPTRTTTTEQSARAALAAASFFPSINPRQISLTTTTSPTTTTTPARTTAPPGTSDEEAPLIVNAPEQVASPTATFELSDNASTVVEHHRRPWLRTFRRWFSRNSNDNNNTSNMEDTTISLTQPLIDPTVSAPPSSPTATGGEADLMVPLESTLVGNSNNDMAVSASTSTTTSSLIVQQGNDTAAVADNNNTNDEEPIPDPPGDPSDGRQMTV